MIDHHFLLQTYSWNMQCFVNSTVVIFHAQTVIRLTNYAISSGIISVAVYQTPNQPITFVDDPLPNIYKNGRSEDGIIARTWSMFKEDPTEPDVLLRSGITESQPKVNRKLLGS